MQMLDPKQLQASSAIKSNQKQLYIKREIESVQNYSLHQRATPNLRMK